MVRADFSRTVVTSTIKVAEVVVTDGGVETKTLTPIVHVGTTAVNGDKAAKLARATYKTPVVVLGIDVKEEVRGMDFDTFMKYSTPVERPASQRKPKDMEAANK